jgi:hypothetical protein
MQWTGESFVSAIAVLAGIYWKYRVEKKQREDQANKVAQAIATRDLKVNASLQEHPLHSHGECDQDGDRIPLTTAGLRVSKIKINGS